MLLLSRSNDNINNIDVNKNSKCPTLERNESYCLFSQDEKINERNLMPENANYPIRKDDINGLSKKRSISSIPKNSKEFWEYPSSQQFYNSLLRKNKEVEKDYIDAVVSIHNEVNEIAWKQILKYEHMYRKKCKQVSLNRFVGRFDDLSLKARFRTLFSKMGRPFDRHDWYVNRCGTEVKYVLDYYNDESINDDKNIYIDVRPSPNSLSNMWQRLCYPFYEFIFKHIKKDELFR